MINNGQRVLLIWEGKEYYVRAGEGTLSTDKGIIDLNVLLDASPGETIETHLGVPFYIRIPRPTDFFSHARRTGAPMLPKDIGMVCALTGMKRFWMQGQAAELPQYSSAVLQRRSPPRRSASNLPRSATKTSRKQALRTWRSLQVTCLMQKAHMTSSISTCR